MTASERLVEQGLDRTVYAVRRVRRRVEAMVRRNRNLSAADTMARIRAELLRTEPDIARAIEGGILAAWVSAAQKPARELPVDEDADVPTTGSVIPPIPPGPPFGPLALAPIGNDDERPVRWPAIEAAARDLLSRRAVTHRDFVALSQDARAAAYSIAGDLREGTIDAVKDAITHDTLHGGTLRAFTDNVGAALDAAGMSDAQIETTYRTQTGLARTAGIVKVIDHPQIAEEFPYWGYFATHDSRTRPEHMAMETAGIDGTNVFRCDDPIARKAWPPCSYNCRCLGRVMSIEDAAEAGVREARIWLRTGEPPANPAWVDSVPVVLPKDWPVPTGRVPPIV